MFNLVPDGPWPITSGVVVFTVSPLSILERVTVVFDDGEADSVAILKRDVGVDSWGKFKFAAGTLLEELLVVVKL